MTTEEDQSKNQIETDASLLKDHGKPHYAECKRLRIVLLGGRWGGKSSAGNTILGEERFDSGRQRTAQSDNRHATVAGRDLILVDTPGWKGYLSSRETTAADKEEIKRSVCECLPGPHAFLLVVPVDAGFTEEHMRSLVDHVKLLGDRVWRHSMVLFTCGDWLREKTIAEHIETEGKALQWLIEKCKNRFHVLSNKNREDRTQVRQLLDKIDEMVAGNNGGHFEVNESTCQMMVKKKTEVEAKAKERKMQTEKHREELTGLFQGKEQPTELRVVLLGSKNVGKSASGNTILASEEFDVRKGTSKSVVKSAQVQGTAITIVDTPGWWKDFSVLDMTKREKQEVTRSVSLCLPGPHVFLLVIDTDVAFTERQREAVEEHLQLISGNVWDHTMILFSRADWLGTKSIEQHIEAEGKALQWLVEKCRNRYHALDNKNKDNQAQVTELLRKMKEMVAGKRGSFHEVDEAALRSLEEGRKDEEEKAKQRMMKVKEQRKIFQGANNHLPEMRVVLMGQKSSGKNGGGDHHAGARGAHAILLVIPVDVAYKERHRKALEDHLCCLGEEVWTHVIVLFTYGDRLRETTIEEHIEREGWTLQWVVEKCGNRYHLFNNKIRGTDSQVSELLEKMEEMVAGNDEEQFSPDTSQVSRELENKFKRKEVEEMKERYEEELSRREKELKAQFEEEWRRREKELFEMFGSSLMAKLEKDTEKSKLPAKLKTKPCITLNPKERKILKEQRKNEERKNTIQDVLAEVGKRSGQEKETAQMSLDINPPQLSGAMANQNSSSDLRYQLRSSLEFDPPSMGGSTEQMWTENTEDMHVYLRKRILAWSPSTFSSASTGQDSGINLGQGSVQSFSISEHQGETDAPLPPDTGSR
ncbi:hypothetical protein SKAU_G00076650 [Synaphobranchus kaupii]|uniref:AIG1-type G domain-containing protein n=1 Tax=Synaphobranchus kaupii TaxID=118154 RepID=A0A9Q1JC83_SYNKA|nr:hypothetical protein SKAU_G00076650 [Synaphobranchus kaupii]